MLCPYHKALESLRSGNLTRARSNYWITRTKICTCEDSKHTDNESTSAGDNKTLAQQQQELDHNFKVTLNDDTANLLDNMSADGVVNGDAGGGSAVTGDTRRLSVPPSLQTNQDAVDLVQMVDDLLNDLNVTFTSVCKEVFEKLDDMAARIDAMEARALAAQAAEEAEEAAAANAESK